jgi:4-aminobutyrate aminotransferase-like enzyme
VALNEVIDIIEDEAILANVTENEEFLRDSLLSLQSKYRDISGVRGLGYMFGFDTPSAEYAAKAIEIAASRGLIIRGARYGKSRALKVRPPLICTRQHLAEIILKLDETFSVMSKVHSLVKEVA